MRTYILIAAAALLNWGTAVSASAFPTPAPAAATAVRISGRGDDFCKEGHDAAGGDPCTPASQVPIPQPSTTYAEDSKPTPTSVPEDSTKVPGGAVKETGEEVEWVMDKKSG